MLNIPPQVGGGDGFCERPPPKASSQQQLSGRRWPAALKTRERFFAPSLCRYCHWFGFCCQLPFPVQVTKKKKKNLRPRSRHGTLQLNIPHVMWFPWDNFPDAGLRGPRIRTFLKVLQWNAKLPSRKEKHFIPPHPAPAPPSLG